MVAYVTDHSISIIIPYPGRVFPIAMGFFHSLSALPYSTRWTASPRNCVWPISSRGHWLARDIVLNGVFGLASGRVTRDVDFAVALESWEQFEAIKAQLIATGRFEAVREVPRLYYKPRPRLAGYPLDILLYILAQMPGRPALASAFHAAPNFCEWHGRKQQETPW